MIKIVAFVRNTALQKFVIILMWLFLVCGVVLSLVKQPINADACYYIAVSRLLNDGLKLFIDFNPGYTPLSFYLMQVPQLLVGHDFTILLSILFAIQFANSLILYKICYCQTNSKNLSHWAAIFFMMISIMWCPDYVLEPFVLLFGLSSILVLLKNADRYLFISGFLCFCSFWSKQYGLGFLFLVLAYVLVKESFTKRSVKLLAYIFIGFLFGAFFFVCLLLLQDTVLGDCVKFSGVGYEKDGIKGLFESYILLFKMTPLLLLPLFVICIRYRLALKSSIIIVSLFGIAGFMLQCYIRFYGHYLVLAIPFCALLFVSSIQLISKSIHRTYYKIGLFLVLLMPLRFFINGRIALLQSDSKQQQIECAEQVKNLIPEGEVDVFASQDMLYVTLLNTYTPPLLKEYGLSNGFVREPSSILELCNNAHYCIIGIDESKNTKRFTEQVNNYLETEFIPHSLFSGDGEIIGKVLLRRTDK